MGRQDRVEVDLIIRSCRPPIFTHYLNPKLTLAAGFIYDRHATESDFFHDEVNERDAGTIEAISDRRALANVSVFVSVGPVHSNLTCFSLDYGLSIA